MIDGVHSPNPAGVASVRHDGVKHPLALVEGSTENATLVTDLLVDCVGGAGREPIDGSGSTFPRRGRNAVVACSIIG